VGRDEYVAQTPLNACTKCCSACVEEGHGILYCMNMCGCNCDGLFDDVDCPGEEYCEEGWEDYGLDDICGEDSELDPLCHVEDEDEWW
jgi:hypothetical protein